MKKLALVISFILIVASLASCGSSLHHKSKSEIKFEKEQKTQEKAWESATGQKLDVRAVGNQ